MAIAGEFESGQDIAIGRPKEGRGRLASRQRRGVTNLFGLQHHGGTLFYSLHPARMFGIAGSLERYIIGL